MSWSKQILLLEMYKWEIGRLSLLAMDWQHKGYDTRKDKVEGQWLVCASKKGQHAERQEQSRLAGKSGRSEAGSTSRQRLTSVSVPSIIFEAYLYFFPGLWFYVIWVSLHSILIIATKRTLTRTTINGNSTIINQWPEKTNTTSNRCPHPFQ